jgi:hypothetical protein
LKRAVPHLDYVIAQNAGLKGVPDRNFGLAKTSPG